MTRYEYNTYLTSDGSQDIEFLFVETAPSNWRIYILSNINYGSRSTGATDIHRLVEGNDALKNKVRVFIDNNHCSANPNTIYYICWSSTITSIESCRTIAKAWGEITAYYIKHGGSFPSIQRTLADKHII